jgi:hypothetical protein
MCCQFVAGVDELQGLSAGTTLVLQQLCRLYLLYHASSSHLLRVRQPSYYASLIEHQLVNVISIVKYMMLIH